MAKEEQSKYTAGKVATQTEDVVVDNKNENTLSISQALAEILNNQEKILKALE